MTGNDSQKTPKEEINDIKHDIAVFMAEAQKTRFAEFMAQAHTDPVEYHRFMWGIQLRMNDYFSLMWDIVKRLDNIEQEL